MRQHLEPENEAAPGTLHGPSMAPVWVLNGPQSGPFMGQAWAQAQAGWGSLVQGPLTLYEKKILGFLGAGSKPESLSLEPPGGLISGILGPWGARAGPMQGPRYCFIFWSQVLPHFLVPDTASFSGPRWTLCRVQKSQIPKWAQMNLGVHMDPFRVHMEAEGRPNGGLGAKPPGIQKKF